MLLKDNNAPYHAPYNCNGTIGIGCRQWQPFNNLLPANSINANRAVTVVWGMVWGVIVFKEQLGFLQVSGGIIVLIGVALFASSDSDAA